MRLSRKSSPKEGCRELLVGARQYASLSIDYYELGVETGKMTAQILMGSKAVSDCEITTLTPAVAYNEELCAQLGIEVPAN